MTDEPAPVRTAQPVFVAEGVTACPQIMGGMPCIAGTRILTSSVAVYARDGYSVPRIMAEFPSLGARQIADALAWQMIPLLNRMSRIADAIRTGQHEGASDA